MTNNYHYDHMTNTLKTTKAFLKAAGNLFTPEYRIIMAYRADHPDMIITTGEARKGKKHINYKQMGEYIKAFDKSGKGIERFETVKILSKIQPSPYNYVRCWFEETYPKYESQVGFNDDNTMYYKVKVPEVATTPITEKQPNTAPQISQIVAIANSTVLETPAEEASAVESENQVKAA